MFASILPKYNLYSPIWTSSAEIALIAQLGERKTEDLEALCSIHSQGNILLVILDMTFFT
jgi:hypothetical protein